MKRNERLVDFTNFLINHPNQMLNLNELSKHYEVAKSSISEDLVFIKRVFENQGVGLVETFPGSLGGVRFTPYITDERSLEMSQEIAELLREENQWKQKMSYVAKKRYTKFYFPVQFPIFETSAAK